MGDWLAFWLYGFWRYAAFPSFVGSNASTARAFPAIANHSTADIQCFSEQLTTISSKVGMEFEVKNLWNGTEISENAVKFHLESKCTF